MIVHNFDVMRTVVLPSKTNRHWPLIRILYCPALSPDNFSSLFPGLAARSPSVTAIQHNQLALRHLLETCELPDIFAAEKILRLPVLEASDHL